MVGRVNHTPSSDDEQLEEIDSCPKIPPILIAPKPPPISRATVVMQHHVLVTLHNACVVSLLYSINLQITIR